MSKVDLSEEESSLLVLNFPNLTLRDKCQNLKKLISIDGIAVDKFF